MDPVERIIHTVLLAGIAVSVALLAAGVALVLARGEVPRGVVTFSALPAGLAALDPAAYLSLGVMVLIATPFVRVAGSLVAFARDRDLRYVLLTAFVLVVMCLSVALGRA
jgi:uncharacterized membrane protein